MRKNPAYLLALIITAAAVPMLFLSCGGDDDDDDDDIDDDDDDDDDVDDDDDDDDDEGYYDPSWAVPMDVLDPIRDRTVIRGIVHAHSIYSHDACDDEPVGNTECLMELREALCTTRQNYLMLTDHRSMFAENEYPDVLLYLPDEGDELAYDDLERPYANTIQCPDGPSVTIMAGTENDIMPVHIHEHAEGTVEDRKTLYGRSDPDVVPLLRDLGASVIVSHPEGWTPETLIPLAPDAVELFNLHAALMPDLRAILGVEPLGFVDDLLAFLSDPLKPHPNLAIMTFWPETEAWNWRWDSLIQVQRCYAVAATDVHRNALPFDLWDGERADGYRRMMQFFSNHLLVDDESPESIEEALDSGRVYAAFEFLGFPVGFDFYAEDSKGIYDMGDEAEWSQGMKIHVKRPEPFYIDPEGPQPEITVRLIRIDEEGSEAVATSDQDIEYTVTGPAAFRAEVRIVPHHLEPFLGSEPERYIHEYAWIYGSPIYVTGD